MLPLTKGVRLLKQDANGLIALYKPAGVLSHPNASNDRRGTLQSLINAPYDINEEAFVCNNKDSEGKKMLYPLWLLHRLDSATSGVILVSTNEAVALAVKHELKKRKVKKHYTALVFSQPIPKDEKINYKRALTWVDEMVVENNSGELRAKPAMAGENYATAEALASIISVQKYPYRLLNQKQRPNYSLMMLDLQPMTGFTHQLRFQAARHGLPIVGDRTYGNFAANKEFRANMSRHPLNDVQDLTKIFVSSGGSVSGTSKSDSSCLSPLSSPSSSSSSSSKPPFRNHFKNLFLHARRIELCYELDGVRHPFSVEAPLPCLFDAAMKGSE